jgi:hypothetical protein
MATADESKSGAATSISGKKRMLLIAGIVGGLTAVQGGVFFFLLKASGGGPTPALGAHGQHALAGEEGAAAHGHGAPAGDGHGHSAAAGGNDGEHGAGHGAARDPHAADPAGLTPGGALAISTTLAEVQLLKSFRVPNNKSGRTYIYDFDLTALVPAARQPEAEALVKHRSGQIADFVTRTVRSAEPRILNEDDFRTLRGQLQAGLAEMTGDDLLIQRVLIPRCMPIRAE